VEGLVVLLAGVVTGLIVVVNYLWAKLRFLERAVATLAPVHAVEAVGKKVETLEQLTGQGFSKTAEVMGNLNTAVVLLNATVRLNAASAEETYLRKSELN
jgi:hypothetical protein